MIIVGSAPGVNVIFYQLDSRYNGDNNKMLIRIIHTFLNRNTNIIM